MMLFVYDIVCDIVYEILQYIGQIGIQRLRKVASMYRTIEIGSFSGPTRAWAIWYETKPFACPPRMQSPFAFILVLLECKVLAALKTFVRH